MVTNLRDMTLREARDAFVKGDISAREITNDYLLAIEENSRLNAYITVCADRALDHADNCDRQRKSGITHPLSAVPLAIKDLFCTKDVRTTCASRILENFIPPYESAMSDRLSRAGGIVLGKTNLDEFAMGSANLNSFFGPVINPWRSTDSDVDRVPGGSSGGSAAAVAAGIALAAIGTDTGGSIRQPAAFCGVVGLKPTYGRCSRYGMIAFSSSLDQAGPLTRNVEDAALMLNVMAGHDVRDSTSAPHPQEDFTGLIGKDIKSLTIGVPRLAHMGGIDKDVQAVWDKDAARLKDAGATIVDIVLPHASSALPAYYIIAPAEASSNLARYDGVRYGFRHFNAKGKTPKGDDLDALYSATRGQGFGAEVKRRIMIGTYVLSSGYYDAYYLRAAKVRALIRRDFDEAFAKVDAILTPSTPGSAFAVNDRQRDPVQMYLNDVFTVPASLAGLPAISVPTALDRHGMPLASHLIAAPFQEATLLQVASALERAADFSARPPVGVA